ncbi:MAG: phosphopentomutase, partial [Firmicutes bacterium]|nr:phosphopentomutase [Bacillota bacterium]
AALTEFDRWLPSFMDRMEEDDILLITADHGCDPSTESTDHSREYIPLLAFGDPIRSGADIGTRIGFSDISATILDYFGLDKRGTAGESFLPLISYRKSLWDTLG